MLVHLGRALGPISQSSQGSDPGAWGCPKPKGTIVRDTVYSLNGWMHVGGVELANVGKIIQGERRQ